MYATVLMVNLPKKISTSHNHCDERLTDAEAPCGFGRAWNMKNVVYYGVIKRELNRRLIYECRCDERHENLCSSLNAFVYLSDRAMCKEFIIKR